MAGWSNAASLWPAGNVIATRLTDSGAEAGEALKVQMATPAAVAKTNEAAAHGISRRQSGRASAAVTIVGSVGAGVNRASSISIRASAMSCNRRFASF